METLNWYENLIKPSWAPAPNVFGIVWSFLYVLIFISFGAVFVLTLKKEIPFLVALPFALNLIFNIAYSPIQFGLKNNYLASIVIILVLVTLVWAMIAIFPHAKWISLIQIPYLIWVIIATTLQLSITYLNR